MKKILLVLFFAVLSFNIFSEGAYEPSADEAQTRATKQSMQEAQAQIGMPAIINFQERKLMKMILELRDRSDLICYAYSYSEYTGKYTFIGQCIGYGLPYSVQYTNPEYIAESYSQGGFAILPQPDPNGLFMPDGLSATWVMLINPNTGEAAPMYMEPSLTVSQFPLPANVCLNGINS